MDVLKTLSATIRYETRDAFLFAVAQELKHLTPPYGEGAVHRAGNRRKVDRRSSTGRADRRPISSPRGGEWPARPDQSIGRQTPRGLRSTTRAAHFGRP
jgi:hypothetical protein